MHKGLHTISDIGMPSKILFTQITFLQIMNRIKVFNFI